MSTTSVSLTTNTVKAIALALLTLFGGDDNATVDQNNNTLTTLAPSVAPPTPIPLVPTTTAPTTSPAPTPTSYLRKSAAPTSAPSSAATMAPSTEAVVGEGADAQSPSPTASSPPPLKVGDAGVTFDSSKFEDDKWPQMREWVTAGVRGGIPHWRELVDDPNVKVYEVEAPPPSTSEKDGGDGADTGDAAITKAIENAKSDLEDDEDEDAIAIVLLNDGVYEIYDRVSMRSRVLVVGKSRKDVVLSIKQTTGSAVAFLATTSYSGLANLTIRGSWGTPKYDWKIKNDTENYELPDNDNVSINLYSNTTDNFLDALNVYESAEHPIRCNGNHNTFRDLDVDRVFNKNSGGRGYFILTGGYNLVTDCKVTRLRHFTMQGRRVEYNVVYDNDFRQEISFHDEDNGNNLVERNRITLPEDMPPGGPYGGKPNYVCIMGQWSVKHSLSLKPNYLYRNQCLDLNHGGRQEWSDPDLVYSGPIEVRPEDPYTNFPPLPKDRVPKGKTLYPVVLRNNST